MRPVDVLGRPGGRGPSVRRPRDSVSSAWGRRGGARRGGQATGRSKARATRHHDGSRNESHVPPQSCPVVAAGRVFWLLIVYVYS